MQNDSRYFTSLEHPGWNRNLRSQSLVTNALHHYTTTVPYSPCLSDPDAPEDRRTIHDLAMSPDSDILLPPPSSNSPPTPRPACLSLADVKASHATSPTPAPSASDATVAFSPLTDSVTIEMNDMSSPALAEKTIVDEIKVWERRMLLGLRNILL